MYQIYKVVKGDNLVSIAKEFRTTEDMLREINGFDVNHEPQVGDIIIVPRRNVDLFKIYVIQKGDTLTSIAKQNGIKVDDIVLINGLNPNDYIYPGEQLLLPLKGTTVYKTKEGDTLNGVAARLDANPVELIVENTNVYLLPEQLLVHKKNPEM